MADQLLRTANPLTIYADPEPVAYEIAYECLAAVLSPAQRARLEARS